MKKIILKIFGLTAVAAILLFSPSCKKDLLKQQPTVDLGASAFWITEADATIALMGAYSSIRPLFDRDYYMDGHGEYVRTRGTSGGIGGSYNPVDYGSGFDNMYRALYGGVNRANYVIENVTKKMLPNASAASLPGLEAIVAEARLLRGIIYFRLISMPYIGKIIYSNSEVATLSRIPIGQVKDSIMADFNYAFQKLPAVRPAAGRAAKPAALAFRGKLNLFWACWNKNGWPELAGFTPLADTATAAFTRAAADFKAVVDNYGLTLFRNGDPGSIDALGKADILPNYYYLFQPVANSDGELIMAFTHGGTGTGQSEELMRDVSGRSHEGSQCWVSPRYEIADRYQSRWHRQLQTD
jgi:hypothetical protein